MLRLLAGTMTGFVAAELAEFCGVPCTNFNAVMTEPPGGAWPHDAYFFLDGDSYVSFNTVKREQDNNMQSIHARWPGLPNNLDAVFTAETNYSFFFKQGLVYKWNASKHSLAPEYPKNFSSEFPGLPDDFYEGVDTAFAETSNGRLHGSLFFTRGDRYAQYDLSRNRLLATGGIATMFPGMPASDLDAVFVEPLMAGNFSKYLYFLKGLDYWAWDMVQGAAVHGYPKAISDTFALDCRPEVVAPPVAPEPTPELLEPMAGIFAARLSFGPRGSPEVMGLTFESSNETFARFPGYSPTVWWAESAAALQLGDAQRASCISSENRSCYTVAPFAHYCNMTGLRPRTRYFYAFGDAAVGVVPGHFSVDYSFTTPPALGERGPLTTTAVVYADMGLDYSDETRVLLAELAEEESYDFVIHAGDISYADSRISSSHGTKYQDYMNLFYANVTAYARRVPYMLAPGNHEYPCNYGEYEARAAMMPFRSSGSSDVQYYSYTIGQTRMVSLSGEDHRLDATNSTEMLWFEQELAAAAEARSRGEIAFIITHVHYPSRPVGYCSSTYASECCTGEFCVSNFMTELNMYTEDLLVKYGVDIHFTGHIHQYERTTPVYRYQAFGNGSDPFPAGHDGSIFQNPKYPIYVVNGNAGNDELMDGWLARPEWSVGLRANNDGYCGAPFNNFSDFGFNKFTMRTGDVDGKMDSVNVQYISGRTGVTLDEFTVFKDPVSDRVFV